MPEGKWNFAEVDPNDPPSEKIERGGLMVVGAIGLILLTAGLLLVWKTGAYSFDFFGDSSKTLHSHSKTEADILFLMNLPWIAGLLMTGAAVRHFFRKQ